MIMEHHGLQEVSLPGFLILLLVIGSANALSFWRLAQCCQLTGEQTYMGIARKAFGARWAKLWQLPGGSGPRTGDGHGQTETKQKPNRNQTETKQNPKDQSSKNDVQPGCGPCCMPF